MAEAKCFTIPVNGEYELILTIEWEGWSIMTNPWNLADVLKKKTKINIFSEPEPLAKTQSVSDVIKKSVASRQQVRENSRELLEGRVENAK